jgi:RNA polymerase sigma factor for flagellar operon FliA
MIDKGVDPRKKCIKDFLKSLTRTEKVIVVLHYYEEMTIPEIAKSLELSPSEVSQMHSSIISRCKSYLREQ